MSATRIVFPAGPGYLSIDRREDGGDLILSVHGDVDLGSVPTLREALQDAEDATAREDAAARRIVLDLAHLDFIDSSGLHLLLVAHRRARSRGHALVLAEVPPHARRLFRLTGVDADLPTE